MKRQAAATAVAQALGAEKLVYLSDVNGVRRDKQDADSLIHSLTASEARALIRNGTVESGMIPKVEACLETLERGVNKVHIIDGRLRHSLLLEIYVHDGIGTMVIDEKLESLREAGPDDVGGILQLIEPFEKDGTLVTRSRTEIERDIANYTIIEHDGVIFACAALYPYPEGKTAEMAALTVSPQSQGQGDGEKILKRIEQRARAMGLSSIFVLTTRTMHWFIKRGFAQVDPDWLPEARKRKYNWDRKSQVLVKKLG